MKDKKIIIGTIVIIVVIIAILLTAIFIKNKDTEKPEDILSAYVSLINEQKYDEMYSQISEESKSEVSQEDFVKRNKNIYEGIDAYDIKITVSETKKEKAGIYKITYDESMSTAAGTINFTNTAKVVKENKEYKIDWSSSMIFPQLRNNDKVRISSIESKRGEILDRNDNKLAANGTILTVGIVPGKLGDKEGNISKISELTGVSTEYINSQLSASYVKDDTFVPIKKISASNENLKNQLLQISGVMINTTESRVYTLGEEAAHLIGYVQKVNADDLKEQEGKGYNANSLIGKSGLEKAYEDTLRGIDGKEIYITDENGNRLTTLAKQEKQDGKDVKLTIDSNIQKKLYEQLKDDKGFFVVMNPKTGELLATVSTPSYDSNDFVLGLTNDKWNELNKDTDKPLYNRFLQSYCPGSTFKPITAAIGLSSGKLTTDTTFNYSGLKWQKSSSWGDIYITTLTTYSGTKNIRNALIHSDNIFFAQAAMQIGSATFCEELKKLGFNESINEQIKFPLTIKKSQYSNLDKIDNEKKLADSGYGQGDVLVNPIHMASIYSAFANEGNMIKPYIEYKENAQAEILKENVFSAEIANTIKDDLIQVVENPEGTAKDMQTAGVTIAGKTGTAELKTSQNDTEGGLLGWFDCFTVNNLSGNDMLIISMVENTQSNGNGGSHYLIKKIKTLFVK